MEKSGKGLKKNRNLVSLPKSEKRPARHDEEANIGSICSFGVSLAIFNRFYLDLLPGF
jgi:hypothetical protein